MNKDTSLYAADIVATIQKQVKDIQPSTLIVAVSGGIDSSVVFALLCEATQRTQTKVLGIFCRNSYLKNTIREDSNSPLSKVLELKEWAKPKYEQACIEIHNFEVPFCFKNMKNQAKNHEQQVGYHFLFAHVGGMVTAIPNSLWYGTMNQVEHLTGFFGKRTDAMPDFQPLLWLPEMYDKAMIYDLGTYLGIPDSIQKSNSTGDENTDIKTEDSMGLTFEEIANVYRGIPSKSKVLQTIDKWGVFNMHKRRKFPLSTLKQR